MSFAPASSRGAFLKARLAVNGIQCAARSFGTLTGEEGGLLSSIGGLFANDQQLWCGRLSASGGDGNANPQRALWTVWADLHSGLAIIPDRRRRSRTLRLRSPRCRA